MSDPDVLQFLGFLFIAYATGWTSGYMVLVFKRTMDLI